MFVKLSNVEDVKGFVNCAMKMKSKVTVSSLNAVVDASSIMGILTLDLSKPIELQCEDVEEAKDALEQYITEV